MQNTSLLAVFLIVSVAVWAYMTLWFLAARLTQRTDVIDSAWGLGFVFIAWLTWLIDSRPGGVHLLAVAFVTLWGIRLCTHISLRNRKKTEDYRYVEYRKKWGDGYWLKAYLRIFLVQGVLLMLISTTSMAIITSVHLVWHWLAGAGFILWAIGMIIEAEADAELVKFLKTKKPGQIMTRGLWRFSRHPNYFGEVVTWCGAAIVAASVQQPWGLIGAAVITFLITRVSGIPPLERHYADNKEFQKYAKRTSVFFPLPPRK